jgi:hypothetical protein
MNSRVTSDRFTDCRLLAVVCLCGALLAASSARADPPNYQRYVIGERALGMGGAQTAAVNDPMCNLYNPGAMVFITSSMVSASKAIYSLDYRKVEGGFVPSLAIATGDESNAIALENKNDLSLPSTLAIVAPFGDRLYKGGPKRHAFGIGILVPLQDSYTFRGKWKAEGDIRDAETFSLSESHHQSWLGVSYAFRASEQWGLGVSAYLVRNSFSRHYSQSRFGEEVICPLETCGFIEFKESDVDIDTVSLLFRVGALWKPHENWRFGLTISAPTILLPTVVLYKTEGKLDQTTGNARVEGDDDDIAGDETDRVEYFTDDYKLKVAGYEPMNFRLGAAYVWYDIFAIDVDVSVHLPVSYKRIKGDPVADRRFPEGEGGPENLDASGYWFDPGIIKKIERRPVVNFNIGWEHVIDDTWTIRNGFFTDFSSAPPVKPSWEPQLWHINRYGATLAGGFKRKGYDISVGVMGAYGRGTASVYDIRIDGNVWQPAPLEERAIYVFIAGVQSAAVKGAKQLYKKAKEGELFSDEPEESEKGESEAEGESEGATADGEAEEISETYATSEEETEEDDGKTE